MNFQVHKKRNWKQREIYFKEIIFTAGELFFVQKK
jgi:hypothetical protein